MSVHLAFSTCPDLESAQRLADALVGERLAACVNILPGMHSTYQWQGKVERSEEVQLVIKTTAERLPALAARLTQLHPYELPELVAVPVAAGLPAYLHWIAGEARDDAAEES